MHPVIIIGGGPVGLTASIALSQQNIPHLLFERHASTAIFPKSVGLNQRTVEYFRTLGLEDEIYRAGAPPESVSQTAWYSSLGPEGKEIYTRDSWGGGQYKEEYARASPSRFTMLPQIRLEPILHRRAKKLNPDGIINSATVVGIEDGSDYVQVHVEHKSEWEGTRIFDAQYILAADGGRMVADALGIQLQGERNVMDMVSGHFKAQLRKHHPSPHSLIIWFIDPELGGSIKTGFLYHLGPYPTDPNTDEWLFACGLLPDESRKFGSEEMLQRIHQTLKIPDLEIELKSVNHWDVNAVVAERYRSETGRVFLVGDAAHRLPPWGALGLNSGVQDIQNLVWKLARALNTSDAADQKTHDVLLDTYEKERQPIARRAADTSMFSLRAHSLAMDRALGIIPDASAEQNVKAFRAFLDKTDPNGDTARASVEDAQRVLETEFHAPGIETGWFYPTMDILGEASRVCHGGQVKEDGEFDLISYHPSALPGHHLPHVWITRGDTQISTRDLIKKDKCVLVATARDPWVDMESRLMEVEIIEGSVEEWKNVTGVDDSGAVLVRPDGMVLWRFKDHDAIYERFKDSPDMFIEALFLSSIEGMPKNRE